MNDLLAFAIDARGGLELERIQDAPGATIALNFPD
jgi:hypothetical protein